MQSPTQVLLKKLKNKEYPQTTEGQMTLMTDIAEQLNTIVENKLERVHKEFFSIYSNIKYDEIPEFTFAKQLKFHKVSFSYLGNAQDTISNISLEIQKGESIGVIGKTGSGKSTLIDLILGLLRPNNGSIIVDGNYRVCSTQWHNMI